MTSDILLFFARPKPHSLLSKIGCFSLKKTTFCRQDHTLCIDTTLAHANSIERAYKPTRQPKIKPPLSCSPWLYKPLQSQYPY